MATNTTNTYDASRPIPRGETITPVRKSNAALYWGIALAILVIAAISWSFSRNRTADTSAVVPATSTQQNVGTAPATDLSTTPASNTVDSSAAATTPATSMEPGTGTGIATGLNRGSMNGASGTDKANGVVEPGNGVTNGPSKGAPENAPNK